MRTTWDHHNNEPHGKRRRTTFTFPRTIEQAEREMDISINDAEITTADVQQAVTSTNVLIENRRRNDSFKLQAIRFFLTFPQSGDVTRETAMTNLRSKCDVDWAIVAQEQHKDGTPHLHVLFRLKTQRQFTGSDCFDFVTGKHGNYTTVRNLRSCLKYIVKSDKDYLKHGTIDIHGRIAKNAGNKSDTVAALLLDGKSLMEIVEDHPGYVMMHQTKMKAFIEFSAAQERKLKMRDHSEGFMSPPDYEVLNADNTELAEWIEKTFDPILKRKRSDTSLWLYGETGLGKTRFFNRLSKYLHRYDVPLEEDFYDAYANGHYDFLYFDEFKGQKTVTFLNRFISGEQMNLRQKGSQVLKTDRLPAVIVSNYSPADVYHKMDQSKLATLLRRLTVIHFIDEIEINPHVMAKYALDLAALTEDEQEN